MPLGICARFTSASSTSKQRPKLFADETTLPVLDPGRGRTKTGQLWAYAADDGPWRGSDPPGVAYVYASDRKAERPITHLDGFKGILQVDGYAGYRKLAERGDVQLAFCWAMSGVTSTTLPLRVLRRLPAKRFNALPRCRESRRISVAVAPRSVAWFGSRDADR